MQELNYQLFQEFQQFQQKQQFKLPPQQNFPPQNHQFMPQNETQEQQNQDVQHQQNETQEQRNVEVQQTQEQQNQDVQDQQNEQDLFRRLCQTVRNKGLQKLRSCLPIAAVALAGCGASAIAVSPRIQRLSQVQQLVIDVAVVFYVALSTAVTWNGFPGAVKPVRRGWGIVEKAVCYCLTDSDLEHHSRRRGLCFGVWDWVHCDACSMCALATWLRYEFQKPPPILVCSSCHGFGTFTSEFQSWCSSGTFLCLWCYAFAMIW